jgi:aryl-alcohol dehydrogenase-like predicted oxidoreductase
LSFRNVRWVLRGEPAYVKRACEASLAWVSAQAPRLGVPVVPIPGTKRVHRLEENAAALDLALTDEDVTTLDALADQVVGGRY